MFWIVATLLLAFCVAHADPDMDYLQIYNVFSRADQLAAKGQTNKAHAYYLKAQRELQFFQQTNPRWHHQVMNYRLDYLAEKINETAKHPAPAKKEQPVAANAPTQAAAKSTTQTATASTAKSPLKLLTTGKAPRTALRLHPTVGDEQTMNMTMKTAMSVSAAGKTMPAMNIPPITMGMKLVVKNVAANGDIHYGMTFENASVAADSNTLPAIANAMKASLAGIQGMTASAQMTSQGIVKDIRMKMPAGVSPQLRQTMSQMKESFSSSSVPFPDEPVGPGAKWEYSTKLKNQGMTIDQTATYELVSIQGDKVTLHMTLTQNAPPQKIQNPTRPGFMMELNKFTGSGSGKSVFNLAHIMPISGKFTESTDMAMSMNTGQRKQNMTMKMDVDVSMKTE